MPNKLSPRCNPRVFIDSITQFRYLSPNPVEFQRYLFSFFRFLTKQVTTVLFTSEVNSDISDDTLRFVCDGVIQLELSAQGRALRVLKFRGSDFFGEQHSFRLTESGIKIFPLLLTQTRQVEFVRQTISSGVPELDELLHGGLERGTVTLFSGPTGTGKTTIGLQFMKEAAGRGGRSVVYTFEEEPETLILRCENVNIPVRAMLQQNKLAVHYVEPLRFSADEFAYQVRQEVPSHEISSNVLIALADEALYQAKAEGRHRMVTKSVQPSVKPSAKVPDYRKIWG